LYKEMIAPARLADGSTRPYGFGLRLQELRGRPIFVHGGAGGGLDTDSLYMPSEDIFVAVFANSDDPATDPATLTRRLAALALGEPIPSFTRAEIDLARIEPFFGSYTPERGPPFRFYARDGRLYMGRGDDEKEVFPAGADRFFFGPETLMWFEIRRRADGAHVLELNPPDVRTPERAARTGAVPSPLAVAADVLRSYVGTYATEVWVVTVSLGANGRLTISLPDQPPLAMRPVSDTDFRVDDGGFRVVFHAEKGEVKRLTLHRGARELHGQRTGP
jgi:hypothetical protein